METPTISQKIPFDKVAYAREYQKKRYHSDPVFKQRQLEHVKKLYKTNKQLLEQYKIEIKHKETSNTIT